MVLRARDLSQRVDNPISALSESLSGEMLIRWRHFGDSGFAL